MKKFLPILGFVIFTLLFPSFVSAEKITDYHAQISLEKNGKIQVAEKIVYDFGSLDKHGIYREIPSLKSNKEGKKLQMSIDVQSVKDENEKSYPYKTSWLDGEVLRIKIGDANALITGEHTYIITYEVGGAVSYFSDHDELYWNITGNRWVVPIEKASLDVSFPSSLSGEQVKAICYTGSSGSTAQNCSTSFTDGKVISQTTESLGVGEGLTTAVSFPMGLVARLEPKPVVDFFDTFLGKIVFVLIIIVALAWYVVLPIVIPFIWWKKGRDPRGLTGEVRAWFDPPQTQKGRPLGPAETGTLVDETADTKDIFAAIIDLARQGHFMIVEKKKGDFSFVRKDTDLVRLQPYERELVNGIFEDGLTEVQLKDLEMATTVESVKNKLYKSLTTEGFFAQNPQTVRTVWMVIAGLAFFTGNFFLALVAFIFGRAMPRKTVYGVGQANVGKSLKNFLSSQSRQLEFQAKEQMFFEKLLPYAIAFGVEKVWADRFKDIKLTSPDWYQGYDNRAFTAGYLLSSMNSSYSSFRSVATPTSSSSGFSSGFSGGSSGGGGGGGGGGSW
ncbi:DUF2207 domain-containing protein [Candidatus Roizmanbacteria bacterium]|nr:DUF2207 domain-containing protein [Candidatus Roizmanbacteria bacterium]